MKNQQWVETMALVCVVVIMMMLGGEVDALTGDEISALKDMQAEWPQLGWKGTPSCYWQNLLCNPEGNVIELFMTGLQLTGTIPPSVGNFFALRTLYVTFMISWP